MYKYICSHYSPPPARSFASITILIASSIWSGGNLDMLGTRLRISSTEVSSCIMSENENVVAEMLQPSVARTRHRKMETNILLCESLTYIFDEVRQARDFELVQRNALSIIHTLESQETKLAVEYVE